MIRPYADGDAKFLAPIHTAVFPDDSLSIQAFAHYLNSARDYGGKAWVIEEDSPVGYALAVPVPGLPHIVELKGCVAPSFQRQGLGSRLLQHVLSAMNQSAVRQLSHPVRSMNSPAARFLIKNGFYLEHEETIMRRSDLTQLPQPPGKEDTAMVTLTRPDAVKTFSHLYSNSFTGLPWDQPFSQDEIEATLDHAADILFLTLEKKPVGFTWLHLQKNGLAMIEPLGILPEYQHQGYGRYMLQSALQELVRRGATHVQIGAWRTNLNAIALYQSLGFEEHQTFYFLAHDL